MLIIIYTKIFSIAFIYQSLGKEIGLSLLLKDCAMLELHAAIICRAIKSRFPPTICNNLIKIHSFTW